MRDLKKKVTIQDIADALGISRNTVSKAINNTEGLADSTREKILQKAQEMGYKQFSYARDLQPKSLPPLDSPGFQGEIALLCGTFLNYSHFATLMLDKFQQEISQLGYTMTTHRVTEQNYQNKTLPPSMNMTHIRGILCVEMFNREYDEFLCSLDLPILFVDGPSRIDGKCLPADMLYMDNTTQIVQFVNNMLAHGLTRIGYVGNIGHCQSFFERYTAYRIAMFTADVPTDPSYFIQYNHLDQMYAQIAALKELPDVFVCANDFVAIDLMQALAACGKRVPEDVRICGFDDSAESRMCRPSLTTIHIHTQIMAYSATHLLISRIKDPDLDFRTIHTETDLIYRDSSGTL